MVSQKTKIFEKKTRSWIKGHYYQGFAMGLLFGALAGFFVGRNNILSVIFSGLAYILIDNMEKWSYES